MRFPKCDSYTSMKFSLLPLLVILFLSCKNRTESSSEAKSKSEITLMYQSHIKDLKNLNHTALMTHYADVEDHILFGDGEYWGDYETVNNIWKNFIGDTREILKWNLSNEHLHLLSENSASYLMEYYNERITKSGDTLKVRGSVGYGLKKINDNWCIVTTNVSHFVIK